MLTAEEQAACDAEGGCVLITRKMVAQIRAALQEVGKCGADWKGSA